MCVVGTERSEGLCVMEQDRKEMVSHWGVVFVYAVAGCVCVCSPVTGDQIPGLIQSL